MNAKLFSEAMSEVNDKYYEEAASYRYKKHGWVKWSAMAACFTALLFTALSVLPDYFRPQSTTPPDDPNAVSVDDPIDTTDDGTTPATVDTTPAAVEITISMDDIFFNEVEALTDAALWFPPELYDDIWWDRNDVIDYYGKDLTPAYVPDGLTAANGNGTGQVIADKSGNIVYYRVGFSYHDYGSPKLIDSVTGYKGFSMDVSKIGFMDDEVYILPENEVKTSDIGGTAVTFGYRSMPYGPSDPDTHEPSGYYDLYVAEFELDGIKYGIVAERMEKEEVVKVVASIIYGEEVIVDNNIEKPLIGSTVTDPVAPEIDNDISCNEIQQNEPKENITLAFSSIEEMVQTFTVTANETKGAYTYKEMCELPADELLDLFIQNGLIISDELKQSFTEEELQSLFKDQFVFWHTGECLMDYTMYIDLAEQTKIIYESIVKQ